MKYLRKYNEGFFDRLKRDSPDDKLTRELIERIKYAYGTAPVVAGKTPQIEEIISDGRTNTAINLPQWIINMSDTGRKEIYSRIYLIRFSDIDVLITNDRNAGGTCKEKWKMFTSSLLGGQSGFGQRVRSKEFLRKELFELAHRYNNISKSTYRGRGRSEEGEEWKRLKEPDYRSLSNSEVEELIDRALDERDFKRVDFLNQFLK